MTQDHALDILKSGASVFLTGEPGAGKTYVVNRYVSHLRAHGIEPALTASTGIAATHVGGMTVHSWSGIGVLPALGERDLARIAANDKIRRRITKAKVLIIDEISMLDARVLGMVDAVCRTVRRDGRPFGGLQTVLVGDFFQLPPISRPNGLGLRAEFAFRSAAWDQLRPTVCYLTEQHRQDDREFLAVLGAIRANAVEEGHLEVLRERVSSHDAAPRSAVKLFSHNVDVDRINERELAKLPGATRAFAMEAHGPERYVELLKRSCLSPAELRLKPGAAVMFTRNDMLGRFVNGTIGTVLGFQADTGLPLVKTRGGAEIAVEPVDWKIDDQGRELAAVRQVPLRLAWAMTIHKSQGMSLDAALIDLGAAFEYGQGYVALSRVRNLEGLHLLGWNERAAQVHPEVLAEDRRFRAASEEAEMRIAATPEAARALNARNFIAFCGGRATTGGATAAASRPKPPKAYARWNDAEEQTLVAMFRGGERIAAIAEKLGRQRGGISSRLKKLGLIADTREVADR